jgi:hypothetical protein
MAGRCDDEFRDRAGAREDCSTRNSPPKKTLSVRSRRLSGDVRRSVYSKVAYCSPPCRLEKRAAHTRTFAAIAEPSGKALASRSLRGPILGSVVLFHLIMVKMTGYT